MYYNPSNNFIQKVIQAISTSDTALVSSRLLSFFESEDLSLSAVITYGSGFNKFVQNELPSIIEQSRDSDLFHHPTISSVFAINISNAVNVLFQLNNSSLRKLPIALSILDKTTKEQTIFRIDSDANTSVKVELLKDSVDLTSETVSADSILDSFIKTAESEMKNFDDVYGQSLPKFLNLSIRAKLMDGTENKSQFLELSELPKEIQEYMLSYL